MKVTIEQLDPSVHASSIAYRPSLAQSHGHVLESCSSLHGDHSGRGKDFFDP